MYSSPKVLASASSLSSLGKAARSFNHSTSMMTKFVLEMVKLGKSFRQTRGLQASQIIMPKWSSVSSLDKSTKDKQGEND